MRTEFISTQVTDYSEHQVGVVHLDKSELIDQDPYLTYQDLKNNLNLVIGGDVQLPDGSVLYTDGFLREAYKQIEDEIAETNSRIEETKSRVLDNEASTKGRIRIFGWTLRRSDSERAADKQRKDVLKDKNEKESFAKQGIKQKNHEIKYFLDSNNIDPDSEVKQNLDHVIEIEKFLLDNPDTTDFQSIAEHATKIGLSLDNLRDDFAKVLQVMKKVDPIYIGYRNLVLGQDTEEKHIWGLKDYQKELERVEEEFRPQVGLSDGTVAQLSNEVALAENANEQLKSLNIRLQDLQSSLNKIDKLRDYLKSRWLPDPQILLTTRENLMDSQAALQRLSAINVEELRLQDQVVGRIGSSAKQHEKAQNILQKRIGSLRKRFDSLVRPLSVLGGWFAPRELKQAVKQINQERTRYATQGWDELYEESYNPKSKIDEVAYEAVNILLGKKDSVRVRGVIELTNITEDVAEINNLPKETLKENAQNLLPQDIALLSSEQATYLLDQGLLSPRQAIYLSSDQLAASLNRDVLKEIKGMDIEESEDTIKQILIKSIEAAKQGKRGLPTAMLPRMITQAILEGYSFINSWNRNLLQDPKSIGTNLEKLTTQLATSPLSLDKAIEELKVYRGFSNHIDMPDDVERIYKLLIAAKQALNIWHQYEKERNVTTLNAAGG